MKRQTEKLWQNAATICHDVEMARYHYWPRDATMSKNVQGTGKSENRMRLKNSRESTEKNKYDTILASDENNAFCVSLRACIALDLII